MKRRRSVLIRDATLAIIVATMLFAAWKVIAFAFAIGPWDRVTPLRSARSSADEYPCIGIM